MGGTGGGGGGGSVPNVSVPKGVANNAADEANLGRFTAGLFPGLLSLINWSGDIATGGNFNQGISQANEWGYTSGLGDSPQSNDPSNRATYTPGFGAFTGGPEGGWATGPSGSPGMIPWGNQATSVVGTPSQMTLTPAQMQQLTAAGYRGYLDSSGQNKILQAGEQLDPSVKLTGNAPAGGDVQPSTLQQFFGPQSSAPPGNQATTVQGTPSQGRGQLKSGMPMSWDWVAHDAGLRSKDIAQFIKQGKTPEQVAAQFGILAPGSQSQSQDSLLGPFLSTAWNQIGQELNTIGQEVTATGQLKPIMADTAAFTANQERQADFLSGQANTLFNQGESLISGALTPEQKALVDQATESEKTAIASQLGASGLGSSTSNVMLQGEAEQQGAATAGGLINQNRQIAQGMISLAQQQENLAQGASKLALGGQELSLGEQVSLEQEMSNIFQQNATVSGQAQGLQQQMWSQAMQGYGVLGDMIKTSLSAFGLSTQGLDQYTQASIADSQAAAHIEAANISASSQSGEGLGKGLGSLFQGIGGLFGAGGAAAGGSLLAGAGAAGASAGGGAIASAAGLAFTAV